MTEQQVREIIRDELSKEEKEPFRGGWFTARIDNSWNRVRRWRDPETGDVWNTPNKKKHHCRPKNFDLTYENIQWEYDAPFRGGWFTGTIHGVTRRRWRDPWTGDVFLDDSVETGRTLFEDYNNVRWSGDAPVRQEWPPTGFPVLVQCIPGGDWLVALSDGLGGFRYAEHWRYHKIHDWKYIPANWDNAPKWASRWVITSKGDQEWSTTDIGVGEEYYTGSIVVHVEDRPE